MFHRPVVAVIRFLDRQPKLLILLLAFVGLALVGLLDYFVGHDAAIGFLYLAPIVLTAWQVGAGWGTLFSVLGAATPGLASMLAGSADGPPPTAYPDVVDRAAVFLLATLFVSAFRTVRDQETALARTDALTGAANMRRFHEQLDREIRRCRRYRHPFTLIYGDLDSFKTVNDRLGHAAGDTLLQQVAESMQRAVRNTDIVARLGGDEFAVLLPETDADAADLVARQLRQGVLDAMQRCACPTGGSFGVVTCVDPPASAESLLALADELMYAAKRERKSGLRHAILSSRTRQTGREPTAAPTAPSSPKRRSNV